MATKTQYILGLVAGVSAKANSRVAGNDLVESLQPLKQRMEDKSRLGLNPTESKAPAVLAEVRSAVAAHNAAVQITLGTDEEIIAGLVAADDDTPTEL